MDFGADRCGCNSNDSFGIHYEFSSDLFYARSSQSLKINPVPETGKKNTPDGFVILCFDAARTITDALLSIDGN